MPVICIANQKGGVGKTTTAATLAQGLSEYHKHILLIDWDPQASLTISMGLDPENLKLTGYNALASTIRGKTNPSLQDVIIHTSNSAIDLVPANVELSQAELDLVNAQKRELVLKEMVQGVRQSYDFILVDCLPGLGLLTINALCASDSILIPVQCEYYALEGLTQLVNTIKLVKDNLNPNLTIEGVLLTMADFRTNLTKEVIKEARDYFKEKVYNTVIPRNIRLTEAPGFGKPIALYDKESLGAQKYEELSKEILGIPIPVNTGPEGEVEWKEKP